MEKLLFQEYPLEKRAEFLKDNCITIEEVSYMRRFSQEELIEMKNSLSDLSIQENDTEEERKALVADLTATIKKLKLARKTILRDLKHKSRFVKEPCFKFIDEGTRMVGWYNSEGEMVSSRPMNPEEMQLRIPRIAAAQ